MEAEDQPLPLAGFVHREVSPLFGSGGSFPVLLVVTLFFLHHFCSLLVRDPQVVCPWLALVGPRSLNSFPSVALSSVFFHLESLCSPTSCSPLLPGWLKGTRWSLSLASAYTACQGMSLAAAAAAQAGGLRGHRAATGTEGHREDGSLAAGL